METGDPGSLPYIDVLFMNETEAEHYGRKESAEEAAREFARTAGMAVIKMGKKGSIAVKDGRLYQAAPYIVEASGHHRSRRFL